MNSGEVTLAVFVDFSKAFDTIDFNILIQKLHSLHFSKIFLYLISNYLSNRSHFVQIDSRCSDLLYSKFGALQGPILGPVLLNLCVSDMKNVFPDVSMPPISRRFNNVSILQSERYKILNIFNKLTTNIRSVETLLVFKTKVMNHVLD